MATNECHNPLQQRVGNDLMIISQR